MLWDKLSYHGGPPHDVIVTHSTTGKIPGASCLIPRPESTEYPIRQPFPFDLWVLIAWRIRNHWLTCTMPAPVVSCDRQGRFCFRIAINPKMDTITKKCTKVGLRSLMPTIVSLDFWASIKWRKQELKSNSLTCTTLAWDGVSNNLHGQFCFWKNTKGGYDTGRVAMSPTMDRVINKCTRVCLRAMCSYSQVEAKREY